MRTTQRNNCLAEPASVFIAAEKGILTTLNPMLAYVGSWIQAPKQDKHESSGLPVTRRRLAISCSGPERHTSIADQVLGAGQDGASSGTSERRICGRRQLIWTAVAIRSGRHPW